MKRLTIATMTAAVALGLTAAAAQEATTFDIDVDADGRASYESFNRSFDKMGVYDEWDADRDGMLTRDEFNRGVFGRFDLDKDDYLNPDELTAAEDNFDATVKGGLRGAAAANAEDSPPD